MCSISVSYTHLDQIGIRPLFYGYSKSGKIAFASEAKNLIGWVDEVRAFPPGSYYYDGKFVKYEDIAAVHGYVHEDIDAVSYTHLGKCLNDHLSVITGVGQCFCISGHSRRKNDFRDDVLFQRSAEMFSGQTGPVLQL